MASSQWLNLSGCSRRCSPSYTPTKCWSSTAQNTSFTHTMTESAQYDKPRCGKTWNVVLHCLPGKSHNNTHSGKTITHPIITGRAHLHFTHLCFSRFMGPRIITFTYTNTTNTATRDGGRRAPRALQLKQLPLSKSTWNTPTTCSSWQEELKLRDLIFF